MDLTGRTAGLHVAGLIGLLQESLNQLLNDRSEFRLRKNFPMPFE
jgi:hypothetical protein